MRNVLGLFGRSPFKPLAEHAKRVHDTVLLIPDLADAFTRGDWAATQETYEQISELEHMADELKNEIRDHLPKSMFMPVDRGDILLFLKEQDGIADAAEDLGVLMAMRQTPTPSAMMPEFRRFVEHVVSTSELWYRVADELPLLQEVSFAGPEVEKTLNQVNQIADMEWQADQMQWSSSRSLFETEKEIGAVSVVIWMQILQALGRIANHAENTADLLRLMLARR